MDFTTDGGDGKAPHSKAIPEDSRKAEFHSRIKSQESCREVPLLPCRAELFAQTHQVKHLTVHQHVGLRQNVLLRSQLCCSQETQETS